MQNGVPRILLIRLSAIGDVVRVLPALHALRDAHPHAQIDWAVEPKSAAIVQDHPCVDNTLIFARGEEGIFDNARSFRTFCKLIREQRYDIAIDFHGTLKSGLILKASRAEKRLAFAPPRSREMSHLFANEKVALISQQMNRIEENLELIKPLGAKRHTLDVTLFVPEDVQEGVDHYLFETFHSAKLLAVLHAPVDRAEKQWPLSHFAALSDLLLADGRFDVLLTYGPGQQEVAEKVHYQCRRKPIIAPLAPDLKHFMWLVHRADIFFGCDTGPMHIASAMNVPVAAVFGGTSPAKHAPLRPPFEMLYAGPDPYPEHGLSLEEARECLKKVSPEQAYAACVRLVRGNQGITPLPDSSL